METIHPKPRKTKILLIEDNLDHQILIRNVLRACMPDVDLLTAVTLKESISQLDECRNTHQPLPRLILVDLYLPGREEGWQAIRYFKDPASSFRLIPLTLLSQSDNLDDIKTAYQLGANSYITKPVDYPQWLTYFEALQQYWLHTVTPHPDFSR